MIPVICTLIFNRPGHRQTKAVVRDLKGKKYPRFSGGLINLSDTHTFAIGSMCGFIGRQGSAAATQIENT